MRKETILFVLLTLLLLNPGYSQQLEDTFKPSGKVYGRVFSNVHGGFVGGDNSSAFEITQAYFGYKYNMSEHFSADIKLDIGDPVEASYSKLKRYAYFKLAQLQYKKDDLTFRFGIIGMKQFKLQENFWTRKFVKKTFQDYYKFGASADIGAAVAYQFLPWLNVEALVMNGEGYKDLQTDNTYKGGLGLTMKPVKGLTLYAYSDFSNKSMWNTSYSFFAGYKYKKASIGAEYNLQDNVDFVDNKKREGNSVYASYALFEKWELFARYDRLRSNKLEDDAQEWNASTEVKPYPKSDGDYVIGGIQFTPIKKVKIAFDVEYYIPKIAIDDPQMFGFVHFQFDL